MAGGDDEKTKRERRQERFRLLDLSAVGIAFPVALLFGYFCGRTIGSWLGAEKLGSMIGALLGIAGGFYNLFKMAERLSPRDRAGAERDNDAPD